MLTLLRTQIPHHRPSINICLLNRKMYLINVYHPRNCLHVLEHQGLIGIGSPSNTGKAQRFIFL